MKVGDLVRGREIEFVEDKSIWSDIGVVIEVINNDEVPPVVKVLWPGGTIDKEWSDELEVINAGR